MSNKENDTTSHILQQSPLIHLAALVVVLVGMRAASTIITPFLLALFISIIGASPLSWLKKKGVPNILSVVIVIIIMLLLVLLLGGITGTSVASFTQNLPSYENKLMTLEDNWLGALNRFGLEFHSGNVLNSFDTRKVLSFTANILNGVGNLMSTSVLIMLTVFFILMEASSLPVKIRLTSSNPEADNEKFRKVIHGVRHYLSIKTLTSLSTGILVWIWLSILGVDYPILWGLIAFLMNYIPNIGSLLAAIPAVLLALVQLGPWGAVWTGAGYLVINLVIGSIIEPKIMADGLGLSTLVVFVSLVFWGWLLGIIGMFLSVPLTMIAKIYFEANPRTKWIAVYLSSEEEILREVKKQKEANEAL
ncbi:MAG: AI-2E family transporter [Chlorobi bacterium]|nr:AI-2E family transporter [Chlorobiota bacterium]